MISTISSHPGRPVTLNSEVRGTRRLTKEIELDKGQYKSRFIFIRQNLLRVKNLQISNLHDKEGSAAEIKVSMPMIRSKNKLKQEIL